MREKEPTVTRRGSFDMQVCVPSDWMDHEILAFAEGNNPCGTEEGWMIRNDGDPTLDLDAGRTQCALHDGFTHITLDA